MRGSRTGKPIMVVLDLLGRRSALRLLWELREAGIVLHDGDGYVLTQSGKGLLLALGPLAEWAAEWGNDV